MSRKSYSHSPPAPKQVYFPRLSRAIHVPGVSVSRKRKAQSTLTQLDFLVAPCIPDRMDGAGDGQEDTWKSRKGKKRRVEASKEEMKDPTPRDSDQPASSSKEDLRIREVMDSDEEEQLELDKKDGIRDSKLVQQSNGCPRIQHVYTPRKKPAVKVEHSYSIPLKTDAQSVEYQEKSSHNNPKTLRMTTPDAEPQTPHRTAVRVVPSSETPASAKISPSRSVRRRDYDKSPLKERSANAGARKLRRPITTRCDSENSYRTETTPERDKNQHPCQSTDSETQLSTLAPIKTLRWTSTIADSQADENFEDRKHSKEFEDDRKNSILELSCSENVQQNTYDPVFAALDLDAARYGLTQAERSEKKPGSRTATHDVDTFGSEIDSEVISKHTARRDNAKPVREPLSKGSVTQNKYHRSHRSVDGHTMIVANDGAVEVRPALELTLSSGNALIQVPSSPVAQTPPTTPLRPSQISTVVSTQDSTTSCTKPYQIVPCSPPLSARRQFDVLSSSPVPPPPWNITLNLPKSDVLMNPNAYDIQTQKRELDSLVDFSLPPPPPRSKQQ